jgi:glycerol-3-phosphate acyltransferase PlsY
MTSKQVLIFIVMPLAGYLLGSIPFAWVIGKTKGVDIRTVGSKNIGATNLGRTLGTIYFWYAFLLDAAKGFFPVLVAALLVRRWNSSLFSEQGLPYWAPLLTGIACVVGHLLPLYLKFKGGKGVATGFGVVLGFWPLYTIAGLLAGVFFVFMLLLYRYISLASMTAAAAFALFVAILGSWNNRWIDTWLPMKDRLPLIAVACLFALLIVFRHRGNLSRLIKGTEPKVGQREIDKARMGK